jgi:hypothetical protein
VSGFRNDLVCWIDERLSHVLDAPPMWGCPEAVELQVLQLLQIRALAGVSPELARPGGVFNAYLAYLRERFPRQPQRPLFELIGEDDETYSKLAAGLRGFRDVIVARMAPQPHPNLKRARRALPPGPAGGDALLPAAA